MNRLEIKRKSDSQLQKEISPMEEEENPDEDLNDELGNQIEAMNNEIDPVDPTNLKKNIESFNSDQKKVYDRFMATLEEPDEKRKQLLLIIHGFGGTGKSFLAKCMIDRINLQFYDPNTPHERHVIVAAPTGVAAKNINGIKTPILIQKSN
jgi:DNA replication protein DnaC